MFALPTASPAKEPQRRHPRSQEDFRSIWGKLLAGVVKALGPKSVLLSRSQVRIPQVQTIHMLGFIQSFFLASIGTRASGWWDGPSEFGLVTGYTEFPKIKCIRISNCI